jgi:hypothetical protein
MRLLSAPNIYGDCSGTSLDLGTMPPSEGRVVELTHPQATELLDWLERHGVKTRDLQVADDGTFMVSWAA